MIPALRGSGVCTLADDRETVKPHRKHIPGVSTGTVREVLRWLTQ